MMAGPKTLGRPRFLDEILLAFLGRARRIAGEATTQCSHRLPPLQRLTQRPPRPPDRMGSDPPPRWPAAGSPSRRRSAATNPRATEPGQIPFRPLPRRSCAREIGDLGTVAQPRPVPPCHPPEVSGRLTPPTGRLRMAA